MNANEHDRLLEEVAAYAIGALDPGQVEELEKHLADCRRCQEELRWLSPAVRALPEAVERQAPPPELKQRLMAEVRADADAEARRARGEERRERAESRPGVGEWLRGLHLGGLTWKPLAGLALVVLVVAGGIGYAVGTDGGSSGTHTTEVEPGANGIAAKVVTEGERGEVHLAGVKPLPKGRVLEAWVERDGIVEAVPALFAPDQAGRASTTIEDMKDVNTVMVTREPEGGSKKPTTAPIVEVPIES
ncbi:MAG TPA: anti-sigma factor [Solirubrobacterales bacterium]|jgi:anti-sigma factor RsiW|nr:anti-sigma factor [Solirubrobacterales bacterium]